MGRSGGRRGLLDEAAGVNTPTVIGGTAVVYRTVDAWEFRLYDALASAVGIVGDFNDWRPSATPMARRSGGVWQAVLDLEPGTYRFRYLADDGRWLTDWAAFGVIRNAFGEWDSLLHVPARVSSRRARPADEPGPTSATMEIDGRNASTGVGPVCGRSPGRMRRRVIAVKPRGDALVAV